MDHDPGRAREILAALAHKAMLARGLAPEFDGRATAELAAIRGPAPAPVAARDLRDLPWCSIDNRESRDLDQLSVAVDRPGGPVVLVAIADVDALVRAGSALDAHAGTNTTSVYTAGGIFPMLPERLSTDLTSLNQDADRAALVIEVDGDGALDGASEGAAEGAEERAGTVYLARVRNRARLTYEDVGAWLDGAGAAPAELAAVPGLRDNLRTQDRAAQAIAAVRHRHGALDFETIEAKPVFDGDRLQDLVAARRDRAKELIENLMIAANARIARRLAALGRASIRRVVREPRRWDRIVALAAEYAFRLPAGPAPRALADFLAERRAKDPERFPELSLAVVKLLGPGEYTVERPGEDGPGHFGLALRDYTHSTAPNRRYADLVTHRLVKAALAGAPPPVDDAALGDVARRCTLKEDDAAKVERQLRKSAAALLLAPRVGQRFDGVVTGASDKGTYVRVFHPPVEGRVVQGEAGLDVGDRVTVRLLRTDVAAGFIDFAKG